MRASISRSQIRGRVRAPSSKSYTIRGLICAALAKGESEIMHPLGSDDTEAASDVLGKIGVRVIQNDLWQVSGGSFQEPSEDLYCRESAATLRFTTAVCSLVPGRCRLTTAPSLGRRPITPLLQALRQLGVDCSYQEGEASVVIRGGGFKGGVAELPGNISSQFVSALLLISSFAEGGTSIRLTTPLESQPFVLMTLECLAEFGINVSHSDDLREYETTRQVFRPIRYNVEGDWSSASYLLALGALGGELVVENLNPQSLQGDKSILSFLKEMGASVTEDKYSITIRQSRLNPIRVDLSDCIDLLPTMAVVAAAAEGTSQFTGIERARLKESNRVAAVKEGLERMGIEVSEEENAFLITGSPVSGAVIDSKGDHRIAMAFSLLGTVAGDTTIEDAECVSKTYPGFWDILKSLGGGVHIDE